MGIAIQIKTLLLPAVGGIVRAGVAGGEATGPRAVGKTGSPPKGGALWDGIEPRDPRPTALPLADLAT